MNQPTSDAVGVTLAPPPARPFDVCVVVCSDDADSRLARCLECLSDQTVAADRYEIIVVLESADPARLAAAQEAVDAMRMQRAIQARVVQGPSRGRAAARNAGWHCASAAIVAFVDPDCEADRRWLERGRDALDTHPQLVALCGRITTPGPEGSAPRRGPAPREAHSTEFSLSNVFVRRRALARINGFDERFGDAGAENADLQFQLQQIGPIGECASASVLQFPRVPTWRDALAPARDAFFEALLYKKHPRLFQERARRLPARHDGLVVLLTLATVVLLACGAPMLAGLGLLSTLSLVGLSAWQQWREAPAGTPFAAIAASASAGPFLSTFWRLRGALHFRVLLV